MTQVKAYAMASDRGDLRLSPINTVSTNLMEEPAISLTISSQASLSVDPETVSGGV